MIDKTTYKCQDCGLEHETSPYLNICLKCKGRCYAINWLTKHDLINHLKERQELYNDYCYKHHKDKTIQCSCIDIENELTNIINKIVTQNQGFTIPSSIDLFKDSNNRCEVCVKTKATTQTLDSDQKKIRVCDACNKFIEGSDDEND